LATAETTCLVAAFLPVKFALLVLHGVVEAELNAANGIDNPLNPTEANLNVVVDGQVGEVLNGFNEQWSTAEGEGRVDLV
jgi:hypothetical protein